MDDPLAELEVLAPGLVERLSHVGGVEGIVLGGSRARGTHGPSSDYDLGLYYRDGLDLAALQAVANEYSDVATTVTEPGGWGPWVDGGAWLVVDGTHIDFIYRNVDRVVGVWHDCQTGRYTNDIQPGHPLGFWSQAYAGELALSMPTHVLSSELSDLRAEMATYPAALSRSLAGALWEADFSTANALKATDKVDVAYVAGCLFRAAGATAHAMHGHARQWLVNEKGAIASAARLPGAPAQFSERIDAVFTRVRPDAQALREACQQMHDIVREVEAAIAQR